MRRERSDVDDTRTGMGRKARRDALLEVETIGDDAATWDELSRAKLKRSLGLEPNVRLFTASGSAEPAVAEALRARGWQALPAGADVRLCDLRWVRPLSCGVHS
eukprot:COSAG02_NODE_13404_length_1398_cov_5.295612_2_plen_104_part_00